jgi:hypothetical protein
MDHRMIVPRPVHPVGLPGPKCRRPGTRRSATATRDTRRAEVCVTCATGRSPRGDPGYHYQCWG